jgi:hypothetical protein
LAFGDRVSLCILSWLRTLGPSASASQVLGLWMCGTMPGFCWVWSLQVATIFPVGSELHPYHLPISLKTLSSNTVSLRFRASTYD